MVSIDGEVIDNVLGDSHGITLGLDVGTYMCSLDGPFDGSNDVNFEGIFLGDSLWYNDATMTDSDE